MSYILSLTGSVAVGKSQMSLLIKQLLSTGLGQPNIEIVSSDNFLYPSSVLIERDIMHKKGFPESFDHAKLNDFLEKIKSGQKSVSIPVYSHLYYDITESQQTINSPDILIIEGVNAEILINNPHIDFSIFIDAPLELIKGWYLNRYNLLLDEARHLPEAYLHQLSQTPDKAVARACEVWESVNELNYHENILPYKEQASLVIEKGANHCIKEVRVAR